MKKWIFLATLMSLISLTAQAQFDDVYYDPARDNRPNTATTTRAQTPQPRYNENGTQSGNDANYYDDGSSTGGGDYYEYDDEYDDYAYSTRIRRFHRPLQGFDYYNNAYVDYGYYDPYYYDRFFGRPSFSIVIGNSYWNRYNRYNRWNNSIWFNRYWDEWSCSNNGFNNYYGSPFYSPFGYSSYYSPYGYSNWNDPYCYNGGWGYNAYNRYSNPYQTGHTWVNTPLSTAGTNKYYGPRKGSGSIREVTGPNGQITTGKRGDGGTGNVNPPKNNIPVRSDIRKEAFGNNDATPTNGGGVVKTPKRYETVPSDVPTEGSTDRPKRIITERPQEVMPNNERPTRTYERPAPNYDRPQRNQDATPSNDNDRPTRTYERPAPNYERPQRTETPNSEPSRSTPRYEAPRRETPAPRYEAPRHETPAPRYEAPRQESRSYSPSPSSTPAPSHNQGGGGNGGGGRRGGN